MKKTIGMIGGMGPMATVDLFKKIILATDAREDQEHIHILIDNNTNIPDRTAAILGKGPSPVPELTKSAQRLEAAGADFLIVPCNTAHNFLPQVAPSVKIPFLNMITATAEYCKEKGYKKVGLLASAGTVHTGIYQKALNAVGVEVMQPNPEQEPFVHGMIYNGVKANDYNFDASGTQRVVDEMTKDGAEAFVMGCTEVPVGVEMFHLKGNFIDATEVLAEKAVAAAGYKVISHL